jgi:FecR protein
VRDHTITACRTALKYVLSLTLASALTVALTALPARADSGDTSDAGSTVGRISVLHGNVAMQRGDSGDTVAAAINAPMTVGDYLSTTGGDSRAEVQLDANDFVRVGADSQLRFTQLDPSQETVQLAAGTIELRMFKYGVDPQIDTPSISIRPDLAGSYRVSVESDGSTTFTVRSGSADLFWSEGTRTIAAGMTVAISGSSSNPIIRPVAAIAYDDFDSWNAQRDQYAQQAFSDQYVNADVVGADDLNSYGHWVFVADYGNVWVPYAAAVGPGWAPYHDGRWVWEPYYGWTWVAYEPWGWAPYHYGRWFFSASYGWAWYPGPVYAAPVYRPALVAFFGFGGGGSSFSFAFGNVGWVPLAPYEPFHPWWGPTIVNRRVVNVTNVNVTNVNITNVNITRVYRNAQVAGGVAIVSHDNFTNGGAYRYVNIRPEDLHTVALVKNTVPIVPTRQNLSFTKVDSSHPVIATPLSPRFQKLAAPTNLPPSFDTQRATVQTTTQHLNAGYNAHAGTSVWDRFNTGRGVQTQGSQPNYANTVHTNQNYYHSNPNDPWSKFAPENNMYTAKPTGATHHTATTPHGPKKPGGGSKKPH